MNRIVNLRDQGDGITTLLVVLSLFLFVGLFTGIASAAPPKAPSPSVDISVRADPPSRVDLNYTNTVSPSSFGNKTSVITNGTSLSSSSINIARPTGHGQGSFAFTQSSSHGNVSSVPNSASTLHEKGLKPAAGTRVRPEGLSENWKVKQTRSGGGAEFYNPNNRNESVRLMQGNSNSPYPNSQTPYARQRYANGTYYRQDGSLSPETRGGLRDEAAHIPLQKFEVR